MNIIFLTTFVACCIFSQVNGFPLDDHLARWFPSLMRSDDNFGPLGHSGETMQIPYSEDEIAKCHGMPCAQYESVQRKLEQIMDLQAELQAVTAGEWIGPDGIHRDIPAENGTLDGCIWLTEDQADLILRDTLKQLEQKMNPRGRRFKRTLDRNIVLGWNKWSNMPIKWKFDNTHPDSEKQEIRGAFDHWEANTCIKFQEIPFEQPENDNHLLITRASTGCHSYVGRTSFIPQVLNLQGSCVWQFGIPVHEIGHALGLWHEQQRSDRDDHIRIQYENLGAYVSQFSKVNTVDYGVPYDPQSVMHYSARDGSKNGKNTMEHLDPLFTQSFGQRTGLSFYNAKIINEAYCADTCRNVRLRQPCQRGGYQDPKDCHRCRCPDGWNGDFCERLADAKVDSCGGTLQAKTFEQQIVSPGYNGRNYYLDDTECNWHIKAPAGYRVKLRFEGNFGVYCHYHNQCFHWVETRYKGNMGEPGPRFCCYSTPQDVLVSDGDEMLVLLRANYSTLWTTARKGFKAKYVAERISGQPDRDPPTRPPTTTPTTTPTPTTTTQPTTTTRRSVGSGSNLFSCSFENTWCGIVQDRYDQFDWKITDRPTPSRPTGPDFAYDGRYYAFIEASNPRRSGDQATLYLPQLNSNSGSVCLRFRYHMYGFHINTLRAFRYRSGSKTTIFEEAGQKGNFWLTAEVGITLRSSDQIGFTAIRGDEYSGDIAIDDVTVTTGFC